MASLDIFSALIPLAITINPSPRLDYDGFFNRVSHMIALLWYDLSSPKLLKELIDYFHVYSLGAVAELLESSRRFCEAHIL